MAAGLYVVTSVCVNYSCLTEVMSQSKTDAYDRYGLGSTDLDSIKPISIEPNSREYGNIIKYNLCDVEQIHAKVVELRKILQQGLPPGNTVPERGTTITRTDAKKGYKVRSSFGLVHAFLLTLHIDSVHSSMTIRWTGSVLASRVRTHIIIARICEFTTCPTYGYVLYAF